MAPKANTSTDLAIQVRTSLDVVSLNELASIMRSGERVEIVDDPAQISREIFEQILGAQSDSELNMTAKATGWRSIEGQHVKLGPDFRWRPSTYEEGAPVFLVVPAEKILPDGQFEPVMLTTGSGQVIAQLMNMAARGTLDGRIVSIERTETPSKKGFYPLYLKIHNPVKEEAPAGDES